MAKGDSPDYIVKLPVNGVWHRLGGRVAQLSARFPFHVPELWVMAARSKAGHHPQEGGTLSGGGASVCLDALAFDPERE